MNIETIREECLRFLDTIWEGEFVIVPGYCDNCEGAVNVLGIVLKARGTALCSLCGGPAFLPSVSKAILDGVKETL